MITVRPSARAHKKWEAQLPDGRSVHFGDDRYQDFTQHGDPGRRDNYRRRHAHDGRTVGTAGFWARELLWSEPSLTAAARHVEKKIGKKIRVVK